MIECESCRALWEETQIPNLVPRALFPGFGGGGGWSEGGWVKSPPKSAPNSHN